MKLLITFTLSLLIGTGLIWAAGFDPGFVLLKYGGWSVETSLIVFVVAFILLLIATYCVLISFVFAKQAPKKIAAWQQLRRHRRAQQALTQGLITLEEGRWQKAERLLVRHAGHSETPLLHYLAAARATQKQGESARRDHYLRLAHQTTAGADIAVGVVQAELQLAANQKEQALATLQHLHEVSPKHPYVLQLLQQLYLAMKQWHKVQEVLPDLRKRHALSSAEVKALSVNVAVEQMTAAFASNDWQQMNTVWQRSSSPIRRTEAMLSVYVQGLQQQNKGKQADALIEDYLATNWSDQLVYYFGKLVAGDSLAQLAKAEKWLRNRQDNPCLLLILGRLSASNKLWAKAEQYLLASLKYGETGETYQVLARVLAENNKEDQVVDAYQKGLAFMLTQNQRVI